MKLFKTSIIALLLLGLTCSPLKASALTHEISISDSNQQEIDILLKELNELATEERMLSFKNEHGNLMLSSNDQVHLQSINDRQSAIEQRLEELGAHTIDPQNAEDMELLKTIMAGNLNVGNRSVPDPPDWDSFADCYTVTQVQNKYPVNGTNYNYVCYYITDNKGFSGSPLTQIQTSSVLIGKESTLLQDLLAYQFSFAFSSFLGSIPAGWLIDWTIGTVFTALNSYNSNSTISYSGSENIYTMLMGSVTQMMYCYVYLPNAGWVLCGVRASNITFDRIDTFAANIAGSIHIDHCDYDLVTSHSGVYPPAYVINCVNGGNYIIDRIGSFTVNTYNGGTVRFTPGFAAYPVDLW